MLVPAEMEMGMKLEMMLDNNERTEGMSIL